MNNMVCIHVCPREEALVVAGLLQASEVKVHLLEDPDVPLRPFSTKKPMVRVLVPREAAEFALQIIQDAHDQDFADFEQSAEQ